MRGRRDIEIEAEEKERGVGGRGRRELIQKQASVERHGRISFSTGKVGNTLEDDTEITSTTFETLFLSVSAQSCNFY